MALETLIQNFNNNSLNSWVQGGSGTPANQVKVQNGQVEITTTGVSGEYCSLQAPAAYDMTSSYAFVRLVSAGGQAANFDCLPILVQADNNNQLWVTVNGGNIQCQKKVATVQTQVGSNITYSASIHRWFRIREAAGTTYWDFSTDGQAYQNMTSASNPITMTSITAYIMAGQYGAASADTIKVDNFNFRNSGYHRIGVGDGMSVSGEAL